MENFTGGDSYRSSGISASDQAVGVALLFEGILNLCVAIYTVKIIKNQKQDIIDMDEY